MAEFIPPVSVVEEKGVQIIEFTHSKILDEQNITDIGNTLGVILDEQDRPRMLLDFSTVDHLSSAALGMLININKKVRDKNGELRMANIKPQIMEVFVITKLNKMFTIKPNRAEALASFSQPQRP